MTVQAVAETTVRVGDLAPDFDLPSSLGGRQRLSDLRGQKVVLMFFPFAFSGICTTELCSIRDSDTFQSEDAVTLGISCDPHHALKAFAAAEDFSHALLSDFWPHGQVAQDYGVFLPELGFATRASFILDRDGVIRWSVINGPGEARDTDAYVSALAQID